MKPQLDAYRHADTMGKSPLDLVLMVYDGAIKAMQAAGESYQRNDNQTGYDEVQTAKRMITHLYTTLDRQQGGEVAANLGKMYTWMLSQLQIIEATKNVARLGEMIQVMGNLRSGWDALKNQTQPPVEKAEAPATKSIPEHVVVTA